jgi:hypothetical protein
VSIYSLLAITFLFVHYFCKWEMGLQRYNNVINLMWANSSGALLIAVYSYSVLAAWLVFSLPWLDLFTFQKFTHFQDHDGIMTYFGLISGKQANTYFLVMFLNILGVKAALNIAEAALLLRGGRVKLIPMRFGMVWLRE